MKRLWHIFRLFLMRDGFSRAEYIKRKRLFHAIGESCYYHPFLIPSEGNMVSLGNNVVIATGVQLITHDMTYALFGHDTGLSEKVGLGEYPYYTGAIIVGDNVMIGANVLVLPGVSIGNNVVIGSGSIVTKNIPDGVVVAGNPARVVGDYWELAKKRVKLYESNKEAKK